MIPTKEKGSLDQEDRRDRERRRKEGGRRKKGRRSMKIKKGQRDKPEKDLTVGGFWGVDHIVVRQVPKQGLGESK